MHVEEGDARYVARELLNHDHAHLDRADVFALGAVAYELARGTALAGNGVQYEEIRQGRLMLLPGFSASFQLLLKVRAPCTASASIKGLLTGFPCEAVRARAAVRQCGRTRASQLTPASVAGRRYNCNVLTSCVGWGRAQSMVHKEAAMRPTAGGILKNSALA